MPCLIGATTASHIVAAAVEGSKLASPLRVFPVDPGHSATESLFALPADVLAQTISREIAAVAHECGKTIEAVGVAFPGIVRNGVIEESPNLQQLKGCHMQNTLAQHLRAADLDVPVYLYNDADVVAAGLAATRGQLDQIIRVWTLGNGIGFGRYPNVHGIWEGGHVVVSLDPSEKYCGCGGRGHLEGIMGHQSMRRRFLDLEPDEVFENARHGDARCVKFVKLWHRALAAATANTIHMTGPGKFYLSGYHAKEVDLSLLNQYLHEMVKMSPLQGYVFEIVEGGDEVGVIGAAVNAELAASTGEQWPHQR